MRRGSVAIAVSVGLLAVLGVGYAWVAKTVRDGPAGVGTALAAQLGCADLFLEQRSIAEAERDDVHALAPAAKLIHLSAHPDRRSVTATIPGIVSRTSNYREGLGCTLANPPGNKAPPSPTPAATPSGSIMAEAAPLPTRSPPPALKAAVERIFAETNQGGRPDTRAILVLQDGRLTVEQYAPGFTARTRLLGWSATKSITSALVGVLVREGRLRLDAPAPVPEWRAAGDPRGAITLRQLLTMSSGLKFIEDYVAGSDSSRMLFHEHDMAAYAATQPLQHPPGASWSYSSGTANIVARIVKDQVGGTTEDFNRFARDELFGPLGMESALIEPDEAGNPVGSSYGYATARDWARFGSLYLDRGMVGDRRILTEDWIDFTRSPTPSAPSALYGAMFWLNRGPISGPAARTYPHCPDDMYLASGHNGQFVAVIPSRRAVIVRLGWTPEGKQFDLDRHFSAILDKLPA